MFVDLGDKGPAGDREREVAVGDVIVVELSECDSIDEEEDEEEEDEEASCS